MLNVRRVGFITAHLFASLYATTRSMLEGIATPTVVPLVGDTPSSSTPCSVLTTAHCAILLTLFALSVQPVHAQTPDPAPHERFHQYYQTWKQPGMYGLSCCNANEYVDTLSGRMHISGDCEPTRAEIRNGHWWAKVPDYMIEAGVPAWVEIPDEKVIHERNPSYEEGHLCGTVEHWQGKPPTVRILCFVPPDTGG